MGEMKSTTLTDSIFRCQRGQSSPGRGKLGSVQEVRRTGSKNKPGPAASNITIRIVDDPVVAYSGKVLVGEADKINVGAPPLKRKVQTG